jgi:hypothetical protein
MKVNGGLRMVKRLHFHTARVMRSAMGMKRGIGLGVILLIASHLPRRRHSCAPGGLDRRFITSGSRQRDEQLGKC